MLGIQRSSYMNTLNELKDAGYLDYTTNTITITERERLFNLLNIDY